MTPPNFGSGAGSCLPSMVVVALGEPGTPVVSTARAGATVASTLPASMKTSNNVIGGQVKTASIPAYGQYVVDYCKRFKTEVGADLVGQTAFVTGDSEVFSAAKVLKNFEKEFKKPSANSSRIFCSLTGCSLT